MSRILLVDDERTIRQLWRAIIEQAGHTVEEASNGAEALRVLHGFKADILITDIFMPHVDGLKLIEDAVDLYPNLDIIAVSGGGSISGLEGVLKTARLLGARAVLTKPFTPKELLETVDRILG